MELRRFSQFHYIQAIKKGSVVKVQSVFKGRPAVKYKSLADVYESEDPKICDPVSEVQSKDEFEIEDEISCPPFMDQRTKEVEFDTKSDCHIGESEENECGNSRFSKKTLKDIMRRCTTNKRKRLDNVDVIDETDHYCSPPELSHTDIEPKDGMDDHGVPLSCWKDKLKSRMKLKKSKNTCASSSASNATIVKSEPYQIDESIQQCVVHNLPTPQSVKIEPLESDYSTSVVCISDNSSSAADDYCSIHTEVPVSLIEESHCDTLILVPHNMNEDKPDTVSHVGSCEETVETDPLKVTLHKMNDDNRDTVSHVGSCGETAEADPLKVTRHNMNEDKPYTVSHVCSCGETMEADPLKVTHHKMNDEKPDTVSHVGSCGETVEADPLKVTCHKMNDDKPDTVSHVGSCGETVEADPLKVTRHKMNDDKPDTASHVGSCGEIVEADPLKVKGQESGYESNKYTNNPCRGKCVDTVSAEVPETSGCNVFQSLSSKDEMPGQDNSGTEVQLPNVSVHVNASHMLSCGDEECLSSHSTCNGISHSAVRDSSPSDSEVCKRSSPTSLSVSHVMHSTSNSMESGKGASSSLFDSGCKDEEALNIESDMSSNPVTQYNPPSDSALNGTCPTAKDCSTSWNLNSPASSESCFASVKSNSPTIKDPNVSGYAAEKSVGIQLHDNFDKSSTSAGNGSSDNLKPRHPLRLLSTRKFISPVSQKRLRQILECIDQEDAEDYKCKKKLCYQKYTPDKLGRAEKPFPNRKLEVTAKLKLPEVTSKPKLTMKKTKDCTKYTLPIDSSEIYRRSQRMPNVNTGCGSIKSWSQSVMKFSQWQMQDIDILAGRLLHELKSMKDIVKETLQSQVQPSLRSIYRTDKMQMAINNATRIEESTRRWLSAMSKDCNRFCKIMALTGEDSSATANVAQRERKVTFADELGEELCHVKLFEADMAYVLQHQLP